MIVLIDLDHTLKRSKRLYPDAVLVLQSLREAGHTLVLFSHNKRAERKAKRYGIHHWFDHIVAGCKDMCKEWNWQEVQELYQLVPASNTILFDDSPIHVAAHRARGGNAIRVKKGLQFHHITHLLPWDEVFGYSLSHAA